MVQIPHMYDVLWFEKAMFCPDVAAVVNGIMFQEQSPCFVDVMVCNTC